VNTKPRAAWPGTALALGAAILAPQTGAHTLWINVTPGPEAERKALTFIGYGDSVPGDEILAPDWGVIHFAAYDVIAPDGTRASLGVPKPVAAAKKTLAPGLAWQDGGDVGVRKFTFGSEAQAGTYQVVGLTPVVPLTHYRDTEGREQFSEDAPKDIRNLAKVLGTRLEINYMKSAFVVDKWTPLEPVGYALEIVPVSDLHAARSGDVLRFKVLLNGKPLTSDVAEEPFITAMSPGLGNRWNLHSELEDGLGEVRVTSPGTWRIDARFGGRADQVDALKSAASGTTVWLESSFTFNVLP
jgi:hypothetical protein